MDDLTAQSTAQSTIGDFAPMLVSLTDGLLYGDIWERPGLSKRDRSLVTLASLIATYRTDQFAAHMQRAVDNGVTVDELVEVITHLAFYAGWPNARMAIMTAKELFDQPRDTALAGDAQAGSAG